MVFIGWDHNSWEFKVSSGSAIGLLGQQLGHKSGFGATKQDSRLRDDQKNDWVSFDKANMCFVSLLMSQFCMPRWTPRPGVCWRGLHWPEGTLWRVAMDSGREAKWRCCKSLKTTNLSYAELRMKKDEIPILIHLSMEEPSKTNKGQVEKWQDKMISTPSKKKYSSLWKLCCVTKKMWECGPKVFKHRMHKEE